MALCYSRDGAARPLRVLEQFLREVREKIFNMDDTRSGRLRMTQSSGSDLHKTATENVIDIFEVFHRCNPLLKMLRKQMEVADNLEEVSASDHATTGSDTESDIDTKVRPKRPTRTSRRHMELTCTNMQS